MQYRPPNTNQDVSNTNHFASFSDSLGRLVAASQYMASDTKQYEMTHTSSKSAYAKWLSMFDLSIVVVARSYIAAASSANNLPVFWS